MTTGAQYAQLGLSLVWANEHADWKQEAERLLRRFLSTVGDAEFTPDDLHAYWELHGLRAPHHCNVLGAFFRTVKRKGLIVDTGRVRESVRPERHASKVPVYRKGESC